MMAIVKDGSIRLAGPLQPEGGSSGDPHQRQDTDGLVGGLAALDGRLDAQRQRDQDREDQRREGQHQRRGQRVADQLGDRRAAH
ncbi:hypothetical protein G6F54_014426 [Rhizopus delemar]|nr:hypothetical protein G6F54_014426 [Rhizopus delemar]